MHPAHVEDKALEGGLAHLREMTDKLLARLRVIAREVEVTGKGMENAFASEREAETALVLEVLQAARPAFRWIATSNGPVRGATGEEHDLVLIDRRTRAGTAEVGNHVHTVEWLAFDHPDLGLAVAYRGVTEQQVHPGTPTLIMPHAKLPHWREGGPRLDAALESLVDRLSKHAAGNAARRRHEAAKMAETLRAVQTLLRGR